MKGWIGEQKTKFWLWLWLNGKIYRRFHNVILPSKGGTSQIDHIVVSQYGVFIIETKNYKGWIFGSADKANWIQVLYKEKHSFQNPLRQTFRQKKILAEFLGIEEACIQAIVYFVGKSTFKTELPRNVRNSWLGRYIKSYKTRVLSHQEVERITRTLQQHKSDSTITTKDHIKSLDQRRNSNTNCPRCGSQLVVRNVKKGPKAGTSFLGCEGYPKCRFSKAM